MKNAILLLVCWTFFIYGTAQESKPCSGREIYDFGPVGLDTSNYATIYLTVDHKEIQRDYWYSLNLSDYNYIKINHNQKYIIRVYKPGTYNIWTTTDVKSSLEITLAPKRSYYLRLYLKAGPKYPVPNLTQIDSIQGSKEFIESTAKLINIYNKVQQARTLPDHWIYHDTYVDYPVPNQFIEFGVLRFKAPEWACWLENDPAHHAIRIGYSDQLISETYSETGAILTYGKKRISNYNNFHSYIDQLMAENDRNYPPKLKKQIDSTNLVGKFSSTEFSIRELSSELNMEMHSVDAFIYIEKGKSGKIYRLIFYQIGIPGELRDYDTFKCRALDFFHKVKISP